MYPFRSKFLMDAAFGHLSVFAQRNVWEKYTGLYLFAEFGGLSFFFFRLPVCSPSLSLSIFSTKQDFLSQTVDVSQHHHHEPNKRINLPE